MPMNNIRPGAEIYPYQQPHVFIYLSHLC
jgi:hypothetical protein